VTRLEQSSNTISWTTPREGKARLAVFLEKARDIGRSSYKRLGIPIPLQYQTMEELDKRLKGGEDEAAVIGDYKKTIDSLIYQTRKEIGR